MYKILFISLQDSNLHFQQLIDWFINILHHQKIPANTSGDLLTWCIISFRFHLTNLIQIEFITNYATTYFLFLSCVIYFLAYRMICCPSRLKWMRYTFLCQAHIFPAVLIYTCYRIKVCYKVRKCDYNLRWICPWGAVSFWKLWFFILFFFA